MIELSMPISFWIFSALLLFISGKSMQSGGVLYARGENWMPHTLCGAVLQIIIILQFLFPILKQNYS